MRRYLVAHSPEGLRQNNFDAIRLMMALLVLWSHCFAIYYGTEDNEPLSLLFGGVYNAGNIGVLVFFAISGFLITHSWLHSRSVIAYIRKRVARIYPGFLVAVTLCFFIVVPLYSGPDFKVTPKELLRFVVNNVNLQGYLPPVDAFARGAVNGSLWTIRFEFGCYLLVMALGLTGLLQRRYRWLLPAMAAVVLLARTWMDVHGGGWLPGMLGLVVGQPYYWSMVLPSFLLGAAVYQYRDRLLRRPLLLWGLLLLTVLSAHLPLADPGRSVATRLLMPVLIAYGTFYAAFSFGVRLHGAARWGDFSYGTYLYAFPIQQMVLASLGHGIGFPVYVALSLILSLLAGVCSWFMVERWFLSRVRRAAHKPSRQEAPLDPEAAIVAP